MNRSARDRMRAWYLRCYDVQLLLDYVDHLEARLASSSPPEAGRRPPASGGELGVELVLPPSDEVRLETPGPAVAPAGESRGGDISSVRARPRRHTKVFPVVDDVARAEARRILKLRRPRP